MAVSKKPRKKYNPNKTLANVPPTIRYSKDEEYLTKISVYQDLLAIENNTSDHIHWSNVMFRLSVCLELVKLCENSEAIELLEKGLVILQSWVPYYVKKEMINPSKEQIDLLKSCLTVCDAAQEITTRREQLPIFINMQRKLRKQYDHLFH